MTLLYLITALWITFGVLSFGVVGSNYLLSKRMAERDWEIAKKKGYMPKVSIIVPTYNESEVIEYKLRNLHRLVYPKSLMQFVFVDSHSTDLTADKIQSFAYGNSGMNIQLIVENERKGKTPALNTALKHCLGEIIVVSDADCFWPSGILNDSLGYLAEPSIGAISGPKKLLNTEESWITRNESKYLESMNLMKLGESKTGSTIFFEGGFAAFKKSILDAFDPYNTGSDDCGTVIKVLEQNKRAIMVPEAEFYTFFPKNWKAKMDIKIRRAIQLTKVMSSYLMLLSKGRMKTRKTAIKSILLYIIAPIMGFCFAIMTVALMITFPLAILLLSILLIPEMGNLLFESMSSFFTMSTAMLLVAFKKKSLIWKKPEDRKLVTEKMLKKANLV
jgi:cellulose synthase/poly-beta-1,6-N-acetylglucosamine synthase-like glycosyltransferase